MYVYPQKNFETMTSSVLTICFYDWIFFELLSVNWSVKFMYIANICFIKTLYGDVFVEIWSWSRAAQKFIVYKCCLKLTQKRI